MPGEFLQGTPDGSGLVASEGQPALAPQDRPCRLREAERAIGFIGHLERAERAELAEDRAPFLAIEILADAESREPVMAETSDLLVCGAEQHIDEMADAEALAGAQNGG